MPDEQQALAAIAALNGKEFMERIINVEPARPKTEARAENQLKDKKHLQAEVEVRQHPRENREKKKPWFAPVFKNPGTFRSGRRTHSYIKRQSLSGLPQEAKPRKRSEDNPMRWRKKKPWQKSRGEHKPWEKTEVEARPWKRHEGDARPWRKSEGGVKPWQKDRGEHKPWKKTEGEARPWKKAQREFKPWRKSEGGVKPWQKPTGEAKPWKKPTGEAKPWNKSSAHPQKSGFRGRRKPGGYKR